MRKIFTLEFWQDVLVAVLRPFVLVFFKDERKRIADKFKRITNSCFVAIRHPSKMIYFFRRIIVETPRRGVSTARWFWRTWPRRALASFLIVLLIVTPVYFVFFAPQTEAAWWNDSWRYRKKLTIDSDQVAGELQNFPMLVSLTDTDLAASAQSSGNDIVFTDSLGTKLSHEIESYTAATGVLVAWVKIPNLTDSHDQDLYMYYGNSTCQTQQQPTDVWDENFKMVQHMNQDPSSTAPQMLDSSENNNDGTSGGTMTDTDLVDAKIGKGLDFDGGAAADDKVGVSPASSISDLPALTISGWINARSYGEGSMGYIISKEWNGGAGWYLHFSQPYTNMYFGRYYDGGTSLRAASAQNSYPVSDLNNWVYVTVTWDGSSSASNVKFYKNGSVLSQMVSENTNGSGNKVSDTTSYLQIGNAYFQGRTFDGLIDNFHVSNVIRSAQWIETEYSNQNSPTTFLSVSSQQQERPGLPIGFWPFNEGYGTTAHDESNSGNDGTITGATWQQESECVSGKCLKFDGSGDEVDVGDVSY